MKTLTLTFKNEFKDRILSGEKLSTIMNLNNDIKVGDIIYLMDTSGLLIKKVKVLRIYTNTCINENGICLFGWHHERMEWFLKSEGLDWSKVVNFISNHYGLPFNGMVIEWGGIAV